MTEFTLIEKSNHVKGWGRYWGLAFTAILLNACGATKIVPYVHPQASIKLVGNGSYVFDYSMNEVGLHVTDRNSAAKGYLQNNPWILPPNCDQGIKVLRGGDSQSGGGWILFECKVNQ